MKKYEKPKLIKIPGVFPPLTANFTAPAAQQDNKKENNLLNDTQMQDEEHILSPKAD